MNVNVNELALHCCPARPQSRDRYGYPLPLVRTARAVRAHRSLSRERATSLSNKLVIVCRRRCKSCHRQDNLRTHWARASSTHSRVFRGVPECSNPPPKKRTPCASEPRFPKWALSFNLSGRG